ncbi:b(0,+)-type amino acid transporter 1 [Branchiostoma belcheri]|nr:b(0,+)-type amino acid transporter 1 [Branchiostoma belcheri]
MSDYELKERSPSGHGDSVNGAAKTPTSPTKGSAASTPMGKEDGSVTPDVKVKTPDSDHQGGVTMERKVGLISGVALIVGTMIGSGIFVSPKGVLRETGSVGPCLMIWLACGVLAMLGALAYAELGTAIPKSGAEYPYLWEAFGPIPAYLYSWTSVIVTRPSMLALISLSFADYATEPFYDVHCPAPDSVKKLLAVLLVLLITFANCWSVKLATSIQNFFTAAKLLAVALIIIVGFVMLGFGNTEHLQIENSFPSGQSPSISAIGIAFYQGLWAYDGWNNLNFVTEEIKNPYVNLPRSIIVGIPLVTGCYLLVNIAYFTVMSPLELLESPAVAATLGTRTLGVMAWIIPLSVAFSTFGAANGTCFTSGSSKTTPRRPHIKTPVLEDEDSGNWRCLQPSDLSTSYQQFDTFHGDIGDIVIIQQRASCRLCYVAAREGHMVSILSMVHVRRLTPSPALIFNAVLSVLMILPSNFDVLVNYFSFAAWMFYGGTFLGLIVLRFTKPDMPRPYKVPIGIAIVVTVASAYLVVAPVIFEPALEYLYALLFIFAGLILYIPFVHYKISPKWMDPITRQLQCILDVVPTEQEPLG